MSETPVARKLGIKPGAKMLLVNAPQGFPDALAPLPGNVSIEDDGQGPYDLVLVFALTRADMEALAPRALQVVRPGGLLWLSYPQKSSGIKTDISRDSGWGTLQAAGFRPVSQVAIDETWSALRFRPALEVAPRRGR